MFDFVELENDGASAVKNQAITVRFSDGAQIVGEPRSGGSTEDLRYIELDTNAIENNSRRFKINMLRKGSKISWDFVVINHVSDDFVVEHGVFSHNDELQESDLEVVSTITNEKISPDVTSRIRRILVLLIFTQITSLLDGLFAFGLQELFRPISNLLAIIVWLFLIKEVSASVVPVLEWLRSILSQQGFIIEIGGGVTSSIIAVATKNATAAVRSPLFDQNMLRAVLEQTELLGKAGTSSVIDTEDKVGDELGNTAS